MTYLVYEYKNVNYLQEQKSILNFGEKISKDEWLDEIQRTKNYSEKLCSIPGRSSFDQNLKKQN
jgi:hypothetical protein